MFDYKTYQEELRKKTTEQLKNNLFILWMKDHWNRDDFTKANFMEAEIQSRS
jgi:hypothetical protein